MVCKTENGTEIEINVCGDYDDMQVDEAYYIDPSMPDTVSDEDIAYVLEEYAADLEEQLRDKHIMWAESACEGDR